ncbi:hypothetical protein C2I36_04810 [Rhodobacteraceae bacterium WD3A24]|nr:hypothetical protein C2I36_04810 [Rhodobacteraceae bacterium WD3A24]
MLRLSLTLALSCLAMPALAAETCATNATDEPLLFTMDGGDGGFLRSWLDPGDQLCDDVPAGGRAFVHAFDDPEEFEGCARLIAAGGQDAVMTFPAVDACRWRTHESAN